MVETFGRDQSTKILKTKIRVRKSKKECGNERVKKRDREKERERKRERERVKEGKERES